MNDESSMEKEQRLHFIRNLYAFDLFCQHRFEESLNIFAELGTGNVAVIVLKFCKSAGNLKLKEKDIFHLNENEQINVTQRMNLVHRWIIDHL